MISTRVRVDMYSNVRAVLETNDGKLYMATKFVKAAGGCSAPALKDTDAALAEAGKMQIKTFETAAASPVREGQLMIRHPQYSGLQLNQATGYYIPAKFIRSVDVMRGSDLVFHLEGGISLSENPNIRFTYGAATGRNPRGHGSGYRRPHRSRAARQDRKDRNSSAGPNKKGANWRPFIRREQSGRSEAAQLAFDLRALQVMNLLAHGRRTQVSDVIAAALHDRHDGLGFFVLIVRQHGRDHVDRACALVENLAVHAVHEHAAVDVVAPRVGRIVVVDGSQGRQIVLLTQSSAMATAAPVTTKPRAIQS